MESPWSPHLNYPHGPGRSRWKVWKVLAGAGWKRVLNLGGMGSVHGNSKFDKNLERGGGANIQRNMSAGRGTLLGVESDPHLSVSGKGYDLILRIRNFELEIGIRI